MRKSNYRLKLESNSQFEFQKKAFMLTYICVPPTILQSMIFLGLNKNRFISQYTEQFFNLFFVFLIVYATVHLIWTRIRGNYHKFNLMLEKIGHLCVYGLYIFMAFLISMRVLSNLTVVESLNQNSIGQNCQIVSQREIFDQNQINEKYYELEVQYQYKEFKSQEDYQLYLSLLQEQQKIEELNLLELEKEIKNFDDHNNIFYNFLSQLNIPLFNSQENIDQQQFQYQKDIQQFSDSNKSSNNNIPVQQKLQDLYTIKTKQAKACASNKSKKSLIDSVINFETIPFMYYNFPGEKVKMASWDCIDIKQIEDVYEKCYIINDDETDDIYQHQDKPDSERLQKYLRFQQNMHIDSDLEQLLPYYGITMVSFGLQLFIISFLFEKISNVEIYKMLILRKKKFYIKSIDAFVTFTSIFPKKITYDLIKIELAKTFQIQEDQIFFYVEHEKDFSKMQQHHLKNLEKMKKNNNINSPHNQANTTDENIQKKKQNRYVCIQFMTPHYRMVHSIQAGKKALLSGLFRKEIATEIFQDFINPNYYNFDKDPQYLTLNKGNPYNNTIDVENYLQNEKFLINSTKIQINYLRIYKVLNKQIINNLNQFVEDDEQQQEIDGDLSDELPWVDQFNFADNMNKMLQYIDKNSEQIEFRLLNDDSIFYV